MDDKPNHTPLAIVVGALIIAATIFIVSYEPPPPTWQEIQDARQQQMIDMGIIRVPEGNR